MPPTEESVSGASGTPPAFEKRMISGVGEPWTIADLQETGRLYRIPATSRR
jgi:hypothetical protein